MSKSVYVEGYGHVTQEEVKAMSSVEQAELQVFVDRHNHKELLKRLETFNARRSKNAPTNIVYTDIGHGRVNLLIVEDGQYRGYLSGETYQGMMSRAVHMDSKIKQLPAKELAQWRSLVRCQKL